MDIGKLLHVTNAHSSLAPGIGCHEGDKPMKNLKNNVKPLHRPGRLGSTYLHYTCSFGRKWHGL